MRPRCTIDRVSYALASIIGGTALLAGGVSRLEPRAQRDRAAAVVGFLICACGLALIAAGAIRAESRWALRVAMIGSYCAAGAFFGLATARVLAKRDAGAILARLGTGVSGGIKVIGAICAPMGIIAVLVQLLDAHRRNSALGLIGQALFFTAFGLHFLLLVRSSWCLSEEGIIGPNVFVPWRRVVAYDWGESNTLIITIRRGLLRARRFTIPFVPEARECAAEVLSDKVRCDRGDGDEPRSD